MLGIGNYLWRLVPANPILLRVVEAGGRRRRDLFIRSGYLGLLVALVIFSLLTRGSSQSDLAQLAATSASLFQQMSILQLALVALLSPIFTAGAITQEKDSQTYDILLSTPLTNGQIVLGSLLSRLFFIVALLISGIPIFSITQIFGGVAISRIVLSFLIAAATAFVTGALAMAIATFKVGTRRTIFSFYLFIVIYLIGLFLLDKLPYFHPTLADGNVATTSWFTGLHPFLALQTIFNSETYLPPDLGSLPPELQAWPFGWYLSSPASFYINFMFFLSMVLVLPSIVLLRRVAQSTVTFKGWLLQKLHISRGDRTRKPRYVWANPIAWREARTKASAARASLIRYGFIAAGIIGALTLVIMFATIKPVDRYVTANSIDLTHRTVTIYRPDRPPETLRLSPTVAVRINGNPSTVNDINGDYHVTNQSGTGSTLVTIDLRDMPRQLSASQTRSFLLGAVLIEFAVILLIVTNAAASTVTREKEDGTLDLLLTTPITSRYYIWGKLRGLVSYVLPLVAVPIISILIFVFYDVGRSLRGVSSNFQWIVFPESVLILPGTFIIVAAFASIVGMQMSLRCRKTVIAVMASIGIVVGLCAMLGFCGNAMVNNMRTPEVAMAFAGISPFTIITVLIDPWEFGGRAFQIDMGGNIGQARSILFVFSWLATGAYALVVWWIYKSMVKNFDMTIRRQSR